MGASGDKELVDLVLAGDPAAIRRFVSALRPVVQYRVALGLRRTARARGRDPGQEVEDMSQQVFLALFDDGRKKLRAWDPERGLSLANYVGLLAEREVASCLRRMRRNPWTEEPTEAADLDLGAPAVTSPERQTHARRLLERLLDCLRERLSPRGLHMFKRLYAEQVAPDELAEQEGLGRDAVYQWRSRIKRAVAKCRAAPEPVGASGGAS